VPPASEPPIVVDAIESAEWVADALIGLPDRLLDAGLWEVDRFFDDQMRRPGTPKRSGLLAEQRGPRLFAIGAYIGEVIRRNSGGWKWVSAEG
jgi:hypothetical protein